MRVEVVQLRVEAQLPETVYHASPYAQEIMDQGLILEPDYASFGSHEMDKSYVSTTNLENAKTYARVLRFVVDIVNGNITADELMNQLEGYPSKYDPSTAATAFQTALQGTNGYPDNITPRDVLYAFKEVSWIGYAYDIPAIFGDYPEHLVGKSPEDVGVVELTRAKDMEEYTEDYPKTPEDPTNKYTSKPGEQEYRFYDPNDLIPTRIITDF